eukprot:jgi/Botrbrau1/14333/Bobra.0222s0005.1
MASTLMLYPRSFYACWHLHCSERRGLCICIPMLAHGPIAFLGEFTLLRVALLSVCFCCSLYITLLLAALDLLLFRKNSVMGRRMEFSFNGRLRSKYGLELRRVMVLILF